MCLLFLSNYNVERSVTHAIISTEKLAREMEMRLLVTICLCTLPVKLWERVSVRMCGGKCIALVRDSDRVVFCMYIVTFFFLSFFSLL